MMKLLTISVLLGLSALVGLAGRNDASARRLDDAAERANVAVPAADPPDGTAESSDGRPTAITQPPAFDPEDSLRARASEPKSGEDGGRTTAEQSLPPLPHSPPVRIIRMRVTAYCPCERCCGRWSDGVTASGQPVTADGGLFAAADTRLLPFQTRLLVPGYADDKPVRVLDTGSAIKGNRLDVFFTSHDAACRWGVRYLDVQVLD